MSEATGRADMERRLVQRSLQDDAFRQLLLEDPRAAVEEELGTQFPEEVRIVAVEETSGHHLPGTALGASLTSRRLASSPIRELETVAGGWNASSAQTCSGPGLTCSGPGC